MYRTVEKPGIGTYICTECNLEVYLNDADDKLPPCPKCENTEYTK